MRSLLPIVAAADNFPSHSGLYPSSHPTSHEPYVPLHLTAQDHQNHFAPVGLLRKDVILALKEEVNAASGLKSAWEILEVSMSDESGAIVKQVECVHFAQWVLEEDKMGEVMNALAGKWRKEGKFPGPLDGWRNEQYQLYASPQSSGLKGYDPTRPFSNAAFTLERSACAVFGFATHGVHMTAYEGEGEDMLIWVPRRSATKPTWPSRLDNSVAGGIPAGMTPLEAMVKECDEEASLPESLVRQRMKQTGVVTYFYITEDGYLQPEVEYTYDLQLPSRDDPTYVRLRPKDDEVESFALLSIPQVLDSLHSGEFKPNCGLILVDFLIRHGLVTVENEPALLEIQWRMRRKLGVAVSM